MELFINIVQENMSFEYERISFVQANLMSVNIGDEIITRYCKEHFEKMFPLSLVNLVPSQMRLDKWARGVIDNSKLAFVCGTNLLASNMRKRKQWNLGIQDINIKTKFILCGVGWWQYQGKPDIYTKFLFNHVLSKEYVHSVRDEYTKMKLSEAGIKNVINTGCPTMWNITSELCEQIPTKKATAVVCTLTNYKKDPVLDKRFIEILKKYYKKVYIWLQGDNDYSYLTSLTDVNEICIILPNLKEYDSLLKEVELDYVGTRLHGGIRAINHKVRSIIIGVDNRAVEIGKDTGLKVVKRENIDDLEELIDSQWNTEICMPFKNILDWKQQFV